MHFPPHWSQLKGKKTLIVMDDVDSESQLSVLPKLHYYGKDSCIILTSRDEGIFKFYDNCGIYQVGLLKEDEANKLFCQYAFGTEDIPNHPTERTHLKESVKAVVKKCDGLPLTLEVIGRIYEMKQIRRFGKRPWSGSQMRRA